jgi:hypothetical protein
MEQPQGDQSRNDHPEGNAINDTAKKSYWKRLTEEGPDRHIELFLAFVIAFFAAGQWITSCNNNSSTSKQSERFLDSANKINDAADSFSTSSADISRGVGDAVTKLNLQANQTERLAKDAEIANLNTIRSQQPWVEIGTTIHIKYANPPESLPQPKFRGQLILQGSAFDILVAIKNYGKTPALRPQAYVITKWEPILPKTAWGASDNPSSNAPIAEECRDTVPFSDSKRPPYLPEALYFQRGARQLLADSQIDDLAQRRGMFYVFGCVRYFDESGLKHQTDFCSYVGFDSPNDFQSCWVEHNDY